MKSIPVSIAAFFILIQTLAQNIPVGTWRTHLSYRSIHTLAIAGKQVYAAADNGFFVYDQVSGSSTILSRLDGFGDTQVSRLAYNSSTQTLLIAYTDGNIDLLHENTITNIDDLATSTTITDKQINHIFFNGSLAYLSCNFGVVVLDTEKNEIKETYRNLGAGGNVIRANAMAIVDNTVFLASSQGVLTAPATGVNLLDYNNWALAGQQQGIPVKAATSLTSRQQNVYASIENEGIYRYENGQWQKINLPVLSQVYSLREAQGIVFLSTPGKVITLDASDNYQEIQNNLIEQPKEAGFDADNKLWIADAVNGLLGSQSGNFSRFVPNGPISNTAWQLLAYKEHIGALPGGFTGSYTKLNRPGTLSIFTPTGWENYSASATEPGHQIPAIKDLVEAIYNPKDDRLYIASFGDGLLVTKPDETNTLLNASNSPLQPSTSGDVRITDLAVDISGNVWMTSYGAAAGSPSLYVKKTDNTWQSYNFASTAARFPISLLIDDAGYKWMPLASPPGGIWVFDEQNNRSKYITAVSNQGGLPSNIVSAITTDKEGQVWIGTDRGVAVFYNPFAVFDNGAIDAILPVFERRPLLRDESITAITVDGGNRKWIGTRNGLWLFTPDGSELIQHFTQQNSPLLSDVILDVQIQPVTGEVFIATDQGIVSYRGTATEGTSTHTNVKVFPNPVRPGFEGLITISGLVAQAEVKITDITGRQVYETRAQGSTAVWNGRDYTGRKAASGIYLIFSSDAEGKETMVSKIAIIE
jgi:hypothetical protein